MCGACVVIPVNAIALASELILKWQKGERTIADLRVIVVPFEFVFVLSWMVLWSRAYYEAYKERIRAEVRLFRQGCSHWRQDLENKASQKMSESNSNCSQDVGQGNSQEELRDLTGTNATENKTSQQHEDSKL